MDESNRINTCHQGSRNWPANKTTGRQSAQVAKLIRASIISSVCVAGVLCLLLGSYFLRGIGLVLTELISLCLGYSTAGGGSGFQCS